MWCVAAVLLALLVPAAPADVAQFRNSLAPYGTWVESKDHGTVWTPRPFSHGWRPYTVGHWAYTSDGEWTWVSDEPWGWATYHYGRWAFEAPYGWVWIPGSVWAPAWVAWRYGDGLVGWAPLPPGAEVASDAEIDVPIEPLAFTFVRQEFFADEKVSRHFEPIARSITYIARTKNVTKYTVADARVVNHGAPIEEIDKLTKHGVPRVTLPRETGPPAALVEKENRGKKKDPESKKAMGRRHGREQREFASVEADERKELELRHRAEVQTPPEGVYGAALQRQHEAENSLQMDHERREWQAFTWRQKEEGDVPIPPEPPAHRKHKQQK